MNKNEKIDAIIDEIKTQWGDYMVPFFMTLVALIIGFWVICVIGLSCYAYSLVGWTTIPLILCIGTRPFIGDGYSFVWSIVCFVCAFTLIFGTM